MPWEASSYPTTGQIHRLSIKHSDKSRSLRFFPRTVYYFITCSAWGKRTSAEPLLAVRYVTEGRGKQIWFCQDSTPGVCFLWLLLGGRQNDRLTLVWPKAEVTILNQWRMVAQNSTLLAENKSSEAQVSKAGRHPLKCLPSAKACRRNLDSSCKPAVGGMAGRAASGSPQGSTRALSMQQQA